MNRILTILLLLFTSAASAQVNQKAGEANENKFFNGMVSVNRVFVEPVTDTGLVNMYFLPPFWQGQRKEGAHGWGGLNHYIFRDGKWSCQNCGSGGGGTADGNNYVTSFSFNTGNGTATIGRNGLSSLSASFDGRYALQNHTQPISSVVGLPDSLAAMSARIAAGGGGGGATDSGKFLTRYRADSIYAKRGSRLYAVDFGAVVNGADNAQNRAANTSALLAAINKGLQTGAAFVELPAGLYPVNPVKFPEFANTNPTDPKGWRSIEIVGATLPPFLFGTVGSAQMPVGGTIVYCPNRTPGEAVFYQKPFEGYFSGVVLKFSNLEIRTYNQPQIAAIHAGWAGQLIVENCQITTGVYSVQASVPNMNVAVGIVTPYVNNNALTKIDNVQLSGYEIGIEVNEHTRGDYLNLTCCRIGLQFKQNNHGSYFGRVTMQRCQIGMQFTGPHYVDVAQFNIEHPAPSQTDANNSWQLALYDFDDPNNYATGTLTWTTTVGNVGHASEFLKRGGAFYCTHEIGTPPCVDTSDIPGLPASLAALRASLNSAVPATRTLTINGNTQPFSADLNFSIATGSGVPDSSIYATVKRLRDSLAAVRTDMAAASAADRSRANHTGTQDTATMPLFSAGLNVLRAALAQRLQYSDTAGMLAPYASGIAARLRISDTAAMLSLYARSADYYTRSASDTRYYLATNPNGYATASDVSAASTADRNRANHTGTQTASTISDFNATAAAAAPVQSVAGKMGPVTLTKADVGLANVDNTSDANKPVSAAQQTALNAKSNLAGATFTGPITATNLSGTNTGDQTDITGNAGTVTSIAGLVVAGTNMTRTGSGTTASPYVFNSTASGGGGGSSPWTLLTKSSDQAGPASGVVPITDLTFPVTSGRTYQVRLTLIYTGSGSGYISNAIASNTTSSWVSVRTGSTTTIGGATGSFPFSTVSTGGIGVVNLTYAFIATASGTCDISIAAGVTVKLGSYLEYMQF